VRVLLKSLGWLVLLVLFFVVLILAALAYQPQWLISAFNSAQDDWQVEAPQLNIDLLPPALDLPTLQLQGEGTSVQLSKAIARLDPTNWWQEQPFWELVAEQADFDLVATVPAPPLEETTGALSIPDIAQFLTFSNVRINKINVTGDTSLTAVLRAERVDGKVNLQAETEIDGAAYALTGVITQGPDQTLDLVVDATASDPQEAEPLTAKAHLEAALTRPNGVVALTFSSGELLASVAGVEHAVRDLTGAAQLSPDGETVMFKELAGSYLGAPLNQPVSFQLDGNMGVVGLSRPADAQLKVGASSVEFDGQYAADFSELTGDVELSTSGVPDVIDLAPYANSDLFPASLTGSLRYAASPLQIKFSGLDLQTPTNVAAGDLELVLADAPVVRANLVAERIYVPLTGAKSDGVEDGSEEVAQEVAAETDQEPEADQATDEERVFATAAIDWSWLESAEIDAQLKAKELRLEDARFTDFVLQAVNENGELKLSPLQASLGEGGFTGAATLAQVADSDAVTAGFELDVQGILLEAFGFVPQDQLSGGALEVDVALQTTGNSAADLAAGLNGGIQLMVQDAMLLNDFVELAGSDLLLEALNKLNPFAKSDPTTELNCALVKFAATDGKLETKNQLVMETSKMEIVGSGSVDLNTEKLSITLTPNAKSGIGLNVGSLVKFLKLGGTLSSPRPAADAGGLLKSGLAIGAAISTGGASIVAEGLAKRVASGKSACVQVREAEPT